MPLQEVESRSHDNHVIIDMNMRTLRYKRIHIEHDDADTKRTLSPECSSEMLTEMLTETEADKSLSDTELLDIMRSSYDVIREHGRDDDLCICLAGNRQKDCQ